MIFTLIVGFVVGVFYTRAQSGLSGLFRRAGLALDETQSTLVSFALCLAGAAIVLLLIGVHSYPALLCFGAACGVARKSILARFNALRGS